MDALQAPVAIRAACPRNRRFVYFRDAGAAVADQNRARARVTAPWRRQRLPGVMVDRDDPPHGIEFGSGPPCRGLASCYVRLVG